jgi:hypothetical protein
VNRLGNFSGIVLINFSFWTKLIANFHANFRLTHPWRFRVARTAFANWEFWWSKAFPREIFGFRAKAAGKKVYWWVTLVKHDTNSGRGGGWQETCKFLKLNESFNRNQEFLVTKMKKPANITKTSIALQSKIEMNSVC